MGQKPPSEHPNPHQNRPKSLLHLPQNGIPLVLTHSQLPLSTSSVKDPSVFHLPRLRAALHAAAGGQG